MAINTKVMDCHKDSRKLYALVANITGTKSKNPMPETRCDQELADLFAEFFIG